MHGASGPNPSAQLPIAPRFTTSGAALLGSPARYGSGARHGSQPVLGGRDRARDRERSSDRRRGERRAPPATPAGPQEALDWAAALQNCQNSIETFQRQLRTQAARCAETDLKVAELQKVVEAHHNSITDIAETNNRRHDFWSKEAWPTFEKNFAPMVIAEQLRVRAETLEAQIYSLAQLVQSNRQQAPAAEAGAPPSPASPQVSQRCATHPSPPMPAPCTGHESIAELIARAEQFADPSAAPSVPAPAPAPAPCPTTLPRPAMPGVAAAHFGSDGGGRYVAPELAAATAQQFNMTPDATMTGVDRMQAPEHDPWYQNGAARGPCPAPCPAPTTVPMPSMYQHHNPAYAEAHGLVYSNLPWASRRQQAHPSSATCAGAGPPAGWSADFGSAAPQHVGQPPPAAFPPRQSMPAAHGGAPPASIGLQGQYMGNTKDMHRKSDSLRSLMVSQTSSPLGRSTLSTIWVRSILVGARCSIG